MNELRKEYGILINGGFVKSESSRVIIDRNPATQEPLAEIAMGTAGDVDRAVAGALGAYRSWKNTGRDERARLLARLADIMEENKEHLARVESLDTGKCIGEARMHMDFSIANYRYFASVIQTQEGTLVSHDDGSFSMIVQEPLGVVALILPWNAPTMLMSWKLAPALAAGNCAIIKPAEDAPLPILEVAALFQEVLPPGVLSVVTGPGKEVGAYLTTHPNIAKISFTGSTGVGCGIGEIAGRNVIPCTLELGGKSANIVFPDANLDRAVEYAAIAILSSAGEICCAGSRLFLHEDIHDAFLEKLKTKFESAVVGNPMDPDVQMGPVINEQQMNKILDYIESGKKEGARLVCGGERLTDNACADGFFIAPTLFADVNNSMRIAREEIFGPVLCVLKFKGEEEVIEMANDSEYGLGAGIWTQDINRAFRVGKSLQAGTVWVNDFLSSSHGGPFGGYKKSGIGREVHKMALAHYTNVKNIRVSSSEMIPGAF